MSLQAFHNDHFTLNPPAAALTISHDGKKADIHAHPKTDWWRVPPPEPVESRTGAFFSRTVDATRNFAAGVWVRGTWGVQFDQGCLMLLASAGSGVEGDWIKAGVEVETGREYISAVPAPHSTSTLGDSPYAVYIKIVREGPLLSVSQHFSAAGATETPPAEGDLVKYREVRGFNVDALGNAQAKEGDLWRIGPMVCGPMNDHGTKAEFSYFSFEYL
ncbi:hypothetical protein GGX14DRAFT_410510 [Mycena pura]|uniref:Uncharacterized protein n=1 Tax=Mycena pura TaxID=153505 RepID=A0AAD6YVF7_9AGAR|nr:hypothetical protein GGX14DRAFT_410510 [Mycena pura]